ncbi:hypothetical protein FJ365_05960 [Candidatus Dependentiae bacterium]|nr:hypothetical protein [Candidatus Dependentiae bacterium]
MNLYTRVRLVICLLCLQGILLQPASREPIETDEELPSWAGTPQYELFQGIWHNDQARIRQALKDGAAINQPLGSGRAPLLTACFQEGISEEIILFLIECGADVHTADPHGRTPLYGVCMHGRADLVLQLLPLKVAITAAVLERATYHEAVNTELLGHIDMLVSTAQAGDERALRECQQLATECQQLSAQHAATIKQRKAVIAKEELLYATCGRADAWSADLRVLHERRHRGLVYSCKHDIAQCQLAILVLNGWKMRCEGACTGGRASGK